MLWRIIPFVAAAVSVPAAILPESFGLYRRGAVSTVRGQEADLWAEYGLEAAESAQYSGGGQSFSLTAWRLQDPTSAFGVFQWQRPANSQSGMTAASTPGGSLILRDNYVLRFDGGRPHPGSLAELYKQLPDVTSTSLPPLYGYLPNRGRVPNSERYLLGRAALERFEPRISPELAAFERGAEAQTARYRVGEKEWQLTIISYPTPQMAAERLRQFQQMEAAATRRAGPLVAVVPAGAGDENVARLLDEIAYTPNLTWNEHVSKDTPQDAAKMILAIIALAGILIALSTVLGLFFGGSRVLARRFGLVSADDGFTSLHLDK